MNTEEHDDLWDLLGKARTPEVSPYFSRNVLRAIREESPAMRGLFGWFCRHWQLTAASTCAVALTVGLTFVGQSPKPDPDPVMLLAQQVSASPDYQVINHLDELLASEESSVWLEK